MRLPPIVSAEATGKMEITTGLAYEKVVKILEFNKLTDIETEIPLL